MTARAVITPATAAETQVVEGDSADILNCIKNASVELALWNRTLPPLLGQWVDNRPPHRLPHGRVLVHVDDLDAGIASIIRERERPAQMLAADITDMAGRFAAIARTNQVDIRLDLIRNDACWRFHRDAVSLRLLVTYRGSGTEIPPPEHAERALAEQREYRGPLKRLPRGTVALFKGDPAYSGQGILHRSPPVAGTGVTRLLLCLNSPSAASPQQWSKMHG